MMRDYLALAIDYESLGHPAHVVSLADLVFGVEQYCEMVPVLLDIGRHHRAATGVLAGRQHHEVPVALEVGRSAAGRHRRRGLLADSRLVHGKTRPAMPAERDERNAGHHHDGGGEVEDFVLDLHRSQARAASIAGRRLFSPGCWPLSAWSFSLVRI